MKDKIFYACEGFAITLAGYHWFEQAVFPLLVACVGAVLTVLIQHHLKKYLAKRDERAARAKQNGRP